MDHPDGHIGFSSFGLSQIENNYTSVVEDLAEIRKDGMPFDQVAIELATLYESKYGICPHGPEMRSQRPLALVAMHPKEDTLKYSPLFARIHKYKALKIRDSFGLSLTEFLSLPRYYVLEIIRIAERDAYSESKDVDRVSKSLEEALVGKR